MIGRDDLLDAAARAIKTRSGWYRTYCPFCEESDGVAQGKRNMTIRMVTGGYWCWKCQEKGYIDRIAEAMFQTVEEAKVAEVELELTKADIFAPPEGFTLLGEGYGLTSNRFRAARQYIADRGVWHGSAIECQIGATIRGKYRNSIVVPIMDRGMWRGYVCRRWDSKTYLYPPGMSRGEIMFNMDALRGSAYDDPIMLVEGVFDALPHYPHAVASLGKPSAHHLTMLTAVKRPLAIVLDADAQQEGWALAALLRLRNVNAQFVKLRPGSDPGDTDPDELWDRVQRAF